MTLKKYLKCLQIAQNYAQQNNWLAARNALYDWFLLLAKNPKLIDEKGLLLLLEATLQIKDKLGENELSKGILIYEYITKLQPNKALLWHNLALLYSAKGEMEKSYNAHKKSISVAEFDGEYYLHLLSFEIAKIDCSNEFLSARKILLEKCRFDNSRINSNNNNSEVSRLDFPYLQRNDNTIERAKVLLQPLGGRAGSMFLHSLIDNHPQIATFPSNFLHTFFRYDVWKFLKPNFNNSNWKTTLIENFCNLYFIFFHSLNQENIFKYIGYKHVTEKREYYDYLTDAFNLFEPEFINNKDIGNYRANKELFIEYLQKSLHNKNYISWQGFFDLIHEAWQFCLKRPLNTKFDLYHIHVPFDDCLANCIYLYKNIRLLNIVREPLQSMEYFILNPNKTNSLITSYKKLLKRMDWLFFNNFSLFNKSNNIPSITIRLEDLKRNTDNTLHKLCEWFGVDYSNSLKEETFGNRPYITPSKEKITGFNTANIDRKLTAYSHRDYRILSIIAYPLSVKYKYIQSDNLYIQSEVKYLKNELSKNENYLFDFELPLQQQLKNNGVNEYEIYNIHKEFRRSLSPFINYLENYQTYPGLAELLEV